MAAHPAPLRVDRSAQEREEPGILEAMREDPATRVLVVRGDAAPLRGTADQGLALVSPRHVPEGAQWAFLGRQEDGAPVLAAAFPPDVYDPFEAAYPWGTVREVAAALPDGEADLLVAAVSIGRWLVDSPFCSACGSPTTVQFAGWARRCDGCGRELFPRTDPAVIVAVTSEDGSRLLLGANAAWQGRMYSCFAGFVEAGESLETAIHREIREEAGLRVRDTRYLSSQAWPYPRSLMLGFHATAVDDGEALADGTEIVDVRWFTRDEIGEGLEGRGDVGLPGRSSIAHRLIRAWYEGV